MPERLLHWGDRSELSDQERQEEAKLAALKLAARRRRVPVHDLLKAEFPQTADDKEIVVCARALLKFLFVFLAFSVSWRCGAVCNQTHFVLCPP